MLLVVSGCAGVSVPRPRFPQVEQASEAVQSGGDRYRAHRACANAAKDVPELVGCMQDAGWSFVTRGSIYPEPGCWQARDQGELEHVLAICFVRPAGQSGATGAPVTGGRSGAP